MVQQSAQPILLSDDVLADIAARLRREKAATIAEIRAYPAPIPACDAQFNHLTAQRSRLMVALNKLHDLNEIGKPASTSPSPAAYEIFIEAVNALHPAIQSDINTIIQQSQPPHQT